MARLLASLIFIKSNLFPFTVKRNERVTYIDGLEEADKGNPQAIVDYFATVQKKNIERALSFELEVLPNSLEAVQDIFAMKLLHLKENEERKVKELENVKMKLTEIFMYCTSIMKNFKNDLNKKLNENAKLNLNAKSDLIDLNKYQNRDFRLSNYAFVKIDFEVNKNRFLIDNYIMLSGTFKTIVIGFGDNKDSHTFSVADDFEPKKKNIKKFMEEQLTIELAKIVKQL